MEGGASSTLQINTGRLKHLEMLQQVISRLSNNSFCIKGWSITLLSAILVLIAKDKVYSMIWVAFIPVATFWILDGYFLRQEKLFRKLYDHYRQQPQDNPTDFSMDTSVVSKEVNCWFLVMLSRTLFISHGSLFFIVVILVYLSRKNLV